FDARDGKPVWKTHTIPGPGEPGHESWQGEAWKTGGVSVWLTAHYDPQLNLTFWGTGNAAPWPGDMHPGDNLYSSSVIALDADTGRIRGHHQYHWNDSWDWDEVSTPLLIDFKKDGRLVKGLVHPGRNGYLWRLERRADGIRFVDAKPFVTQEVFTKIDPVSGRPSYDPERKPRSGAAVTFCPGLWGGKDWTPAGYNPKTNYLYIPANENLCSTLVGQAGPYEPGKLFLGIDRPKTTMSWRQGASHIGELQAWDMATGQRVWTHKFPYQNWGPILTTGGGLVFLGGTNDRNFRAFDAKTGTPLWEYKTNSGITGVPSSFAVDGVQYVAVQSGWGVDAQRMQARLDTFLGTKTDVPQGGVVWVFALRDWGGRTWNSTCSNTSGVSSARRRARGRPRSRAHGSSSADIWARASASISTPARPRRGCRGEPSSPRPRPCRRPCSPSTTSPACASSTSRRPRRTNRRRPRRSRS